MESGFSFAFIGCGNMGGAILKGVLATGNCSASEILVVEKSPDRRREWADLGVTTTDRGADARSAPRILIAVKPQDFPAAAAELAPLQESTLVISVMAGLSSTLINAALGESARIVRTMPNTPCQIGAGITAVAPGIGATEEDLQFANELLSTVGAVVDVEEEHMHAVTATSGSGPAYAFLLAEAWLAAAIKQGLDPEVARQLVHTTLAGAAALLAANPDAAELRKAVTSKGGTTAAAINQLEKFGFHEAMAKAVEAATNRGHELDSEVPS